MTLVGHIAVLAVLGGGTSLLSACGHHDQVRTTAGRATPAPRPAVRTSRPAATVDCARARCVALTFDDGPGPHTARLLDHLARSKARATFFVIGGQVTAHAAVVRRIAAEGHELGNHTWSHPRLTGLTTEGVRAQVQRTQTAVGQVAGVRPRLFRPPYAVTDARVGRAAGLPQIMWSVDPMDWRSTDPERTVRAVLRDVRPGAIVLLHDSHGTSVAAVPRLLSLLADQGYRFVTVSELFRGVELRPGRIYRRR